MLDASEVLEGVGILTVTENDIEQLKLFGIEIAKTLEKSFDMLVKKEKDRVACIENGNKLTWFWAAVDDIEWKDNFCNFIECLIKNRKGKFKLHRIPTKISFGPICETCSGNPKMYKKRYKKECPKCNGIGFVE